MQVISTGLAPLLVPVRDEAALRRAERNEPVVRRATEASGGECLYLFAIRGDGDVMARMFDASFGVGEDPATGSAAGPLGVYLASRGLAGMPGDAIVAQGELLGRPSFLHLDVRPDGASWTVRVGGGVRSVGEACSAFPTRPRYTHRRLGDNVAVAGVDLDGEVLGAPGSNRRRLVVGRSFERRPARVRRHRAFDEEARFPSS